MNERIEKLANVWANLRAKDDRLGITYTFSEKALEKFAELIVQECAVYCEGHVLPKGMAEENGLNYNDGVRDCAIGLILELKNEHQIAKRTV